MRNSPVRLDQYIRMARGSQDLISNSFTPTPSDSQVPDLITKIYDGSSVHRIIASRIAAPYIPVSPVAKAFVNALWT